MKRRLALLALFAACSSSGLEPTSGTWYYTGSKLASTTCGPSDPPTDPAGDFTLTVTGDGTFTVDTSEFDSDDFDGVFNCTFDGDSYTCPQRAAGSNKPAPVDATFFYEVSVAGTIESETEVSGTQTVNLRCEGASCDLGEQYLMAELPCTYSYTFTAILR